jgi:hypothetical protein
MNRKLALLQHLIAHPGWHTMADLVGACKALNIAVGSVSPFLLDLQQGKLVGSKTGNGGKIVYRALVRVMTPEELAALDGGGMTPAGE